MDPVIFGNSFRLNAIAEHFPDKYPKTDAGRKERRRDTDARIAVAIPRVRVA